MSCTMLMPSPTATMKMTVEITWMPAWNHTSPLKLNSRIEIAPSGKKIAKHSPAKMPCAISFIGSASPMAASFMFSAFASPWLVPPELVAHPVAVARLTLPGEPVACTYGLPKKPLATTVASPCDVAVVAAAACVAAAASVSSGQASTAVEAAPVPEPALVAAVKGFWSGPPLAPNGMTPFRLCCVMTRLTSLEPLMEPMRAA
jgi:hypothetical protein